jgi:hypothetical protein
VAQNDKSTKELKLEQSILRDAALCAPFTSIKDKGSGEVSFLSL